MRDLAEQVKFVAVDNAVAGARIAMAIRKAGDDLGLFSTGRPGRTPNIYEKSVARLPYVIAYEIIADGEVETIFILRVIHTARDWPGGGWPKP